MAGKMKDSGVEWIGEISEEWTVEPLKFQCTMSKGLPIQKTDLVETGIRVISYGQIHSKSNTGTHLSDDLVRYIPSSLVPNTTSSKLYFGDVVFADTSEDVDGIGNAALIDIDEEIYAGYHTVTCHPSDDVLTGKYFAYLARTDVWRSQLRLFAMGVKVFSITQSVLKKSDIVIPPKAEQIAITHFLDGQCSHIDAAITTIEKEIDVLERYKASLIHETVTKGLNPDAPMKDSGVEWIGEIPEGWEVKKLKHFAKSFESGTSVRAASYAATHDQVGVLSLSAVFGGRFRAEENKAVDFDEVHRVSCKVTRGCLLISRCNTSELVGLPAIVDTSDYIDNLYLPDKMWQLDFGNSSLNRFMWYALQARYARSYCYMMSVGSSSSMQNISSTDLLNMYAAVPKNTEDMNNVVVYLDSLDATIASLLESKQHQLDLLKRQRQSLIYEYVTGKKRVPGYKEEA